MRIFYNPSATATGISWKGDDGLMSDLWRQTKSLIFSAQGPLLKHAEYQSNNFMKISTITFEGEGGESACVEKD